MPAKGKGLNSGPRDLIIDRKFYKQFIEETKIDIDYDTFRSTVIESNKLIADIVVNDDTGFKLPEQLGYLVVTKYTSKKKPIDWINSKKLKKTIYLTNLHSFGYVYHIKWFKKNVANLKLKESFRIEPCREFKRNVAASVKSGKQYHIWQKSDFYNNRTSTINLK